MIVKLWASAARLAEQTPPTRNRTIDLLRALSILVVVLGHWLMAAPWMQDGVARDGHLLVAAPWFRWLTWLAQVMPVFFFVGGFSNGVTWDAARRDGRGYAEWLDARMRRLMLPVTGLIGFWAVAWVIASVAGVSPAKITIASRIAMLPTWFLAVYFAVVMLAPVMREAWRRFGTATIVVPLLLAALGDVAFFAWDARGAGWLNYLFVWLGVHQLGFVWLDRHWRSPRQQWALVLCGAICLLVMTRAGPWPVSLVGVPGEDVSNTTPPHLPLLALAAIQFGVVRLAEPALARLLERRTPWTATVLTNGMIMTVFLWHSTVMMLAFGAALLLGGLGLQSEPASGAWWLARIPWLGVFGLGLAVFVALLARFERPAPAASPAAGAVRQVAGSALACGGIAALVLTGLGGEGAVAGDLCALVLPFAGARLAGYSGR
ncbi:MAG: acyltransferase [Planctomycetota bacterium]|jgi:hypothetical protein|nr:acyltransferase [Planctomycetota bacterium]MDP6989186.1 acyltransferase [Planctomycetota bacterium]